jgi:hypothetical protein
MRAVRQVCKCKPLKLLRRYIPSGLTNYTKKPTAWLTFVLYESHALRT